MHIIKLCERFAENNWKVINNTSRISEVTSSWVINYSMMHILLLLENIIGIFN